jgi:hypothetical protein
MNGTPPVPGASQLIEEIFERECAFFSRRCIDLSTRVLFIELNHLCAVIVMKTMHKVTPLINLLLKISNCINGQQLNKKIIIIKKLLRISAP